VRDVPGVSLKPFAADGRFMPSESVDKSSVRRLTLQGAGATLFAGGVTLGVQVCATIILARLLTPTDFGLVAMVTTFSLLLVNFGFNGFTEAIVQRKDVDHALASTLYWINVGFGAILTLGFAAAGSLLARFYHDPPVRQVAVVVSLSIITTSISTVHLALLKRAMRFSGISVNDICARIISVAVSISLGLAGLGYWALVAGVVAQPVSVCIGAWMLCRWTPGLPRRAAAGTGSTMWFALHTYGNFGVNYISRNVDNLLVGWRFDAQSLGYYKKAYDLFALSASQLVSSIAIVVVAGLSKVNRDAATYRRYLLGAIAIMAFTGMGLGACLTLIGKDLIFVLLGPKWTEAGTIFVYFGPGIGVMIIYATHAWIHLSIGRPDRWFRWAIVEFLVTCTLFIASLRWGPIGIASAWSLSFWILTIPAIWYAGRPISLNITSVFSVIWRYVAASLITVPTTAFLLGRNLALTHMAGVPGALTRVALTSGMVMLLYLGAVVILHGGIAPIRSFAAILGEMARIGKSSMDEGLASEAEAGAAEHRGAQPVPESEGLPLVSILIPAYNAQNWIAATIRSALAQTWPRTEIIVVDDGSKDNTLAIARKFESQGVQVVAQKNQGASAARNKAYSLCQGEYIQWLDADDLLAPDKIATQMEFVMKGLSPRTLLSATWGYFMYRPYRAHFIPTALWCDLSPYQWLLRKMARNVFMQTGAWLVSRELTEVAGPWDIRLLGDDDGEYFCRVLLASNKVQFVPDSKVYYRAFRFDGLSYIGRFPAKIEAHWLSMQLHIKYLRSMCDDPEARAACLQYMRDNLIYFFPERPHILEQARQLAIELGEPLGVPYLSWKYSWIEPAFGWDVTKSFQRVARLIRWRIAREVDYLLYKMENHSEVSSASLRTAREGAHGPLESLAAKETRSV
jgi:O-antigen/teichoic acid export membrane protein/glycosyltransferase involved in cell wall biosynthesis